MLKLVVTFCLVAAATAHFDYARCATGQCFGAPEGCIDAKKCDVVVGYFKEGENFRFEAEADYSATGDVEGKWVGVGLSFDGGRGMGNDAAVACFFDAETGHADNYWNVLDPKFYSYPVEDAHGGLLDSMVELDNQKLHCSFVREAVTEIITPTDPSETIVIDLNTTPFHVMVASGPMGDDGTIRRHTMQGLTADPVDFSKLA